MPEAAESQAARLVGFAMWRHKVADEREQLNRGASRSSKRDRPKTEGFAGYRPPAISFR